MDANMGAQTSVQQSRALQFVWEREEHGFLTGPFPRDVWHYIMLLPLWSSEELLLLTRVHPLFFVLVRDDNVLREFVSVPTFDTRLSTVDMKFSLNNRQARRSSASACSSSGRDTEDGVVVVRNNNTKLRGQRVSFLLQSDFRTNSYVSYFNFQLFVRNKGAWIGCFHYFMVWLHFLNLLLLLLIVVFTCHI
jgi:hypothetical protein